MIYWVRRIHMYLGLLNFSLIAVFGIAGLVATANAPDIMHQKQGPPAGFRDFTPPPSASDRQVGQMLVPLVAPPHAGPPYVHRNAANMLMVDFYSVNGLLRATLLPGERRIRVETFRNSIWRFIDNAHASTIAGKTSDAVLRAWQWYIEIAIWSLVAMALTGAWLGVVSRWKLGLTRLSLAAGFATFVLLFWLEK